ncbi:hypothetical protein Bca4012_094666 [Brassica carinata]
MQAVQSCRKWRLMAFGPVVVQIFFEVSNSIVIAMSIINSDSENLLDSPFHHTTFESFYNCLSFMIRDMLELMIFLFKHQFSSMKGGLWFEELVSGHCLHGGRVASWFGQPPVHGGPLSSRVSDSFVLVWVGEADGLVVSWSWRFVLVGPDVPALVTITYFLLVMAWSCSRAWIFFFSVPRSCVFLVGLLASQWFRPSVLLLRGGGHFSVGRWLSLGCEGPRVRIGGLGRRFPGQSSRVWWGSWCSLSAL